MRGRIRQEQIKGGGEHTNLADQLYAASRPYHKYILIGEADDKRIVTLDKDYEIGSNQLKVWVNGMLQNPGSGEAYIELDTRRIQFNEDLMVGDRVVCRIEGVGGGTTFATQNTGSNSSIKVGDTTLTGTVELVPGPNVVLTVDEVNNKITIEAEVPVVKQRKYRQPVLGTADGVNKVFELPEDITPGSEEIYQDGVLQNFGASNDYTISGRTITFNDPPPLQGSVILASYDPL